MQGADGRQVKRVARGKASPRKRATDKTGMRKNQRAQRTVSESGQPDIERATGLAGENRMGENNRLSVAVQRNFANTCAGHARFSQMR